MFRGSSGPGVVININCQSELSESFESAKQGRTAFKSVNKCDQGPIARAIAEI